MMNLRVTGRWETYGRLHLLHHMVDPTTPPSPSFFSSAPCSFPFPFLPLPSSSPDPAQGILAPPLSGLPLPFPFLFHRPDPWRGGAEAGQWLAGGGAPAEGRRSGAEAGRWWGGGRAERRRGGAAGRSGSGEVRWRASGGAARRLGAAVAPS